MLRKTNKDETDSSDFSAKRFSSFVSPLVIYDMRFEIYTMKKKLLAVSLLDSAERKDIIR